MLSEVRVGESTTDSIEVNSGLRQGCPLAPSSFNIFLGAVVNCWRDKCSIAVVEVRYKHWCKLVGECTPKSGLREIRVTERQFADNAAIYFRPRDIFEQASSEIAN